TPQKAADPFDEWIISTAVVALEPERFRAQAAKAARSLSASAIDELSKRLKKPDLPTLQSRAPSGVTAYEAVWGRAVLEILSHLGPDAIPAARTFLANKDQYIREKALRLMCLLA